MPVGLEGAVAGIGKMAAVGPKIEGVAAAVPNIENVAAMAPKVELGTGAVSEAASVASSLDAKLATPNVGIAEGAGLKTGLDQDYPAQIASPMEPLLPREQKVPQVDLMAESLLKE